MNDMKLRYSTDYLLGGSLVVKNGRIDKFLFDGGYAQASPTGATTDNFILNYYNRDHLGNNREVIGTRGAVRQVTNYYPFGTPFTETADIINPDAQPYKYNGKELDRMHGLDTYDYGARQYYPILGRWDRMDPLCEKYYSISPYAYCANNPTNYIDLHGDSIIIDRYGENLHRVGSSDNVYAQEGESYSEIGVLGETLEVTNIVNNMLGRNAKAAKKIKSIYGFYEKVKTKGEWDLKNLENSIWRKGNRNTTFVYNGESLLSDDIGNFNFGVVAKAYGMAEPFALKAAGIYQIISGTSKMNWINFNMVKRFTASPSGINSMSIDFDFAAPYGDDPKDQMWIKKGYKY